MTRRIRGAILDHARSADHVTRSQRAVLKSIEDASLAGASTAELAAVAGVSEREVIEALAAQAAKPLHLDDALDTMDWPGGLNVPDPAADMESAVAVRAVLGAAARAFAELPLEQQVIVVRVFMHGQDLKDVADALGITRDRARKLHAHAILAIHGAMAAQVD